LRDKILFFKAWILGKKSLNATELIEVPCTVDTNAEEEDWYFVNKATM
jgi:hypothetical protein